MIWTIAGGVIVGVLGLLVFGGAVAFAIAIDHERGDALCRSGLAVLLAVAIGILLWRT
jgi:hypothetical protein